VLKKCQFASLKIPILSVIFNPVVKQRIDVRLDGETVWITQTAMSKLFETIKQNISLHLKNIFSEGELEEESVVKEYLTTAADGKNYRTKMYNLEAIISVDDLLNDLIKNQFLRIQGYWILITANMP
jgi:hypothetical protein